MMLHLALRNLGGLLVLKLFELGNWGLNKFKIRAEDVGTGFTTRFSLAKFFLTLILRESHIAKVTTYSQ
jgi:hypothetical protein